MSEQDAFEDFARSLEAADEAIEASEISEEPKAPTSGSSDDDVVDHCADYIEYAGLERARIAAKKRAYETLIREKFGPFPEGSIVVSGKRRSIEVQTMTVPVWDRAKLREIDVGTGHPTPKHLNWSYSVDTSGLPLTTTPVSVGAGTVPTVLSAMPPQFSDAAKGTKTTTKIKVLR